MCFLSLSVLDAVGRHCSQHQLAGGGEGGSCSEAARRNGVEEVRDLTTHTAVSAVFVSESCIAADVTCTCNIYTIHVVYYVHFRFNFYILLRMLMLSVQYNYTCIILYLHNKLETCYYTCIIIQS